LSDSKTEMPAAVRLGNGAATGSGDVIEKIKQMTRLPGRHQPEGQGHSAVGGQCLHPAEGPCPNLRVGGGHAAIDPFEDSAPEVAHDPDQGGHLVPRRQPRCDGPVVRCLVVLDARVEKTDGART
jgi:hypothetical protein